LRSIFIVLLYAIGSHLIGQSKEISSLLTKGVSDGLADRTVIIALGDSSGSYYIQTPSAIQKYYNNGITQTLHLATYNDSRPMHQSSQYLYRLTNDHCISTIEKTTLTITDEWCLSEAMESLPILTSYTNTSYSFLIQEEPFNYKIIRATHSESGSIVVSELEFSYDQTILAFNADASGRIFLINETDQWITISGEKSTVDPMAQPSDKIHEPQIFIGPNEEVFYSLSNHEGIYKWAHNTSSIVHTTGYILNANWDSKGNILIGTTKSTRLHQDELIFVSTDEEKLLWTELLNYNNRITNVYSDDFNHSILAATYNGIYYLEFLNEGVDLLLYQPELQEEDFGYFIRSFTESDSGEIIMVKEGGDPIYVYNQDVLDEFRILPIKTGYGTVSITEPGVVPCTPMTSIKAG